MSTRAYYYIPALLLLLSDLTQAFTTVDTTGPYVTGVREFEFLDTVYPSELHPNDSQGRRLAFRLYYPACAKTDVQQVGNATTCNGVDLGTRRPYLTPTEWLAYFGMPEPTQITQFFDLTQSYVDAPPLPSSTSFPVVIYGHGFGSFVGDNTVLLEEIASHGYLVAAVASPGFAGGVVYPSDDHIVTSAVNYPEIGALMAADTVPNPYLANYTDDLDVRYDRMELYLTEAAIPLLAQRLTDDLRAVADYLEATAQRTIDSRTTTGSGALIEKNPFLQEILGDRSNGGLDQQIAYMGFSLGGSAAGSAAHADPRAVGAINLDGGHQSADVWNTDIRVPYLQFFEQTDIAWFYHGEFLFENLLTMGSRSDIVRVLGPRDVVHNDYTDQKLFSEELRAGLLGRTTPVDGLRLHQILSEFCLGFLNQYLKGQVWDVAASFDEFANDIEPVDVSYVAEWAQEKFATASPTTNPTDASAAVVNKVPLLLMVSVASVIGMLI